MKKIERLSLMILTFIALSLAENRLPVGAKYRDVILSDDKPGLYIDMVRKACGELTLVE